MIEAINPLARGFYTVQDAARLIEVGSAGRIRAWLNGYPKRDIGPLLSRDYEPIGRAQELSFLDLMEVRFVEHFRSHNVKVTTLRRALEMARLVFKEEKPLARGDIVFIPTEDRRRVFVEEVLRPAAKENKDKVLWDLTTRQMEFLHFIENRLARGLAFDPKTHFATSWVPRPEEFPEVKIDPRIAYGQPTVAEGVPTRALFDAWRAEDSNVPAVADWFNVRLRDVEAAVAFERHLESSHGKALAA